MRGLYGVGIALAALLGCNPVTESSFPGQFAHEMCSNFRACDRASFESEFDSVDDCTARLEAEVIVGTSSCRFAQENAKGCMEKLKDQDCGQWGNWPTKCVNAYVACDFDTGF